MAANSSSPIVALTRHGLARYGAGDFKNARDLFRAVTRAAPGETLAWNNLALAESALGNLAEAAASWRASLDIDPRQQPIWTSLAGALLNAGKTEEAEAAAVQAIALDANDAAPWQIRALARAGREDFAGAAAAFARTVDLMGPSATLCANLGTMLFQCGRFHEAADNFARAVTLDRTVSATIEMDQLARFVVAILEGDTERAFAVYGGRLSAPGPQTDTVFKTALLYLDRAGQRNAAVTVAEAWVAASPDNMEAKHLRDAAQAKPVDRVPAELVAQHFDELADRFDEQLVGRLEYSGPEQISRLLSRHCTATETWSVLDAGCGTGLCAEILRPYARHLEGIDLAYKMIVKARGRGLYDRVGTVDLMNVLGRDRARWDLIVAADALPYFGSLEPMFTAATVALKPGGWFAISTESVEGDGFVLRGSGRHAHSAAYIARLAEGRFEIVERIDTMLRREGGRPLDGHYFLLRRLPDAE
jgi:predicted TPR repeat methyltransferase